MGTNLDAQEVFGTDNGIIQITVVRNGQVVTAVSKKLVVIINYDDASFKLLLEKSTLVTGVDTIDQILRQKTYDNIEFEGEMGIERVKTEKHPPQDFEVNGYITCSPHHMAVVGKGHLEHIFGALYSCILNMTFYIDPNEFKLSRAFGGSISGDLKVEVIQTVLKRRE
jgi:hypothetical protein